MCKEYQKRYMRREKEKRDQVVEKHVEENWEKKQNRKTRPREKIPPRGLKTQAISMTGYLG